MHELEQQLDEPIRDGPHMAITEQRNQPRAGVGMAPELGEGLRRDPQVHAPEIAGRAVLRATRGAGGPEAAGGCPLQSRGPRHAEGPPSARARSTTGRRVRVQQHIKPLTGLGGECMHQGHKEVILDGAQREWASRASRSGVGGSIPRFYTVP